jgi:meso-butanediol dehydrogenase/(S,S)-butanediol dehydrogenase/diacetyl reductase
MMKNDVTGSMSAKATFDFSGAVVVVTGGGTGIGSAVADAFLQAGATVVISSRRKDVLDAAVERSGSDRLVAIRADVSDKREILRLISEIVDRYGRIDVVVSNAAGYTAGDITELADEDWEAMRATNVDGFFHLAKAVLPLLAQTGGNLVAVSSVSGMAGDWNQAGYNATKAALTNFVRSLALDWGRRGVRLNAVAPALTATEPVRALIDDPVLLERFVDRTALGRVGQPSDIAPAVLFLASDAARYVTGVILPVDGGTTASTGQGHN